MKILHVAASLAPDDGGPATAIRGIDRELAAFGTTSMILTTVADGATKSLLRSTTDVFEEDGNSVLYCRRSRPYFLKNSWSQGRRLFSLAPEADLMHVHGVYLANSVWALLGNVLRSTRYVIQPHGTLEPYQRRTGRAKKALFDAVVGRLILRRASALVAASSSEATNLTELMPSKTVIVAPLGVDPVQPAYAGELSPGLQRWLEVKIEKRVIFLGRLAAKKRPDLLVDAWVHADPEARLLIVGPEQDWTFESLTSQLLPDVRDRVAYHPTIDSAGVAWLLGRAGIFVLPSENENFGIAVAEAMFHGCAVITTEQTAASEHVRKAGGGIVLDAPETSALSAALHRLLSDGAEALEMGRRAQEYARAELTWQATASILNAAYGRLTA